MCFSLRVEENKKRKIKFHSASKTDRENTAQQLSFESDSQLGMSFIGLKSHDPKRSLKGKKVAKSTRG